MPLADPIRFRGTDVGSGSGEAHGPIEARGRHGEVEALAGVEFESVPDWLRTVSGGFPLRWLAAGMRSVFPPDEFERLVEPGGSCQLDIGLIVLSAWVVCGFLLAVLTFRWGRERRR